MLIFETRGNFEPVEETLLPVLFFLKIREAVMMMDGD